MEKSFKWKKQMLLLDYGIRDKLEFESSIKVFKKVQKNQVLIYCEKKWIYKMLL